MKFDNISHAKNPEGTYTVTFVLNHQRIAEAQFPEEALAAEYVAFKAGQLVAANADFVAQTYKKSTKTAAPAPSAGAPAEAAYRPPAPEPSQKQGPPPEPAKAPERPIAEMSAAAKVIDTSAKVGKDFVTDHSAKVAPAQPVDVSAKVPGVDLTKPLPVRN